MTSILESPFAHYILAAYGISFAIIGVLIAVSVAAYTKAKR